MEYPQEKSALYIVNYQREIPPFLVNEIKIASHYFNKIVYISPKLKNKNQESAQFGKTSFVFGTKATEFISFLALPFLLLTKSSLLNIKRAFKNHKFSFNFLKEHSIYLYETRTLKSLINKAHKTYGNGIFLAAWFNACSLAVGEYCLKHPCNISFSFAHAFEIQSSVSKYIGFLFDERKIQLNKRVFFISEKVCNSYSSDLKEHSIKYDASKFVIRHLGTFDYGIQKETSNGNAKVIVSCSSAVPVKRLDFLARAFSLCSSADVKWVHLGGGPLLDNIKDLTRNLLTKNSHLSAQFFGKLDNFSVIDFYKNNRVDLFVNVSRSEGLPISIMEAISFGIPVLATNVGGTSEIIDDNCGFLIDLKSSEKELAEKIDSILNIDDGQKSELRKNARKKWEQSFNIETQSNKQYIEMIDLYSKIKTR